LKNDSAIFSKGFPRNGILKDLL